MGSISEGPSGEGIEARPSLDIYDPTPQDRVDIDGQDCALVPPDYYARLRRLERIARSIVHNDFPSGDDRDRLRRALEWTP